MMLQSYQKSTIVLDRVASVCEKKVYIYILYQFTRILNLILHPFYVKMYVCAL